VDKPTSSEAKKPEPPLSNAVWCAFAPGKQAWKQDGNFFTAEELQKMDAADDVSVSQPMERILIAD
jgi:hypothetical protein